MGSPATEGPLAWEEAEAAPAPLHPWFGAQAGRKPSSRVLPRQAAICHILTPPSARLLER